MKTIEAKRAEFRKRQQLLETILTAFQKAHQTVEKMRKTVDTLKSRKAALGRKRAGVDALGVKKNSADLKKEADGNLRV